MTIATASPVIRANPHRTAMPKPCRPVLVTGTPSRGGAVPPRIGDRHHLGMALTERAQAVRGSVRAAVVHHHDLEVADVRREDVRKPLQSPDNAAFLVARRHDKRQFHERARPPSQSYQAGCAPDKRGNLPNQRPRRSIIVSEPDESPLGKTMIPLLDLKAQYRTIKSELDADTGP